MQFKVNVSYSETYTIIVEAKTAQEAEDKTMLQLQANSMDDHEDRSTNDREYEAYTELEQ